MRFPSHSLWSAPVLLISVTKHPVVSAPKGVSQGNLSYLMASPFPLFCCLLRGEGKSSGTTPWPHRPSPGLHGNAGWKRHNVEDEALLGPWGQHAPPTPPSFLPLGALGQPPRHYLVPGLGHSFSLHWHNGTAVSTSWRKLFKTFPYEVIKIITETLSWHGQLQGSAGGARSYGNSCTLSSQEPQKELYAYSKTRNCPSF